MGGNTIHILTSLVVLLLLLLLPLLSLSVRPLLSQHLLHQIRRGGRRMLLLLLLSLLLLVPVGLPLQVGGGPAQLVAEVVAVVGARRGLEAQDLGNEIDLKRVHIWGDWWDLGKVWESRHLLQDVLRGERRRRMREGLLRMGEKRKKRWRIRRRDPRGRGRCREARAAVGGR